MTEKRFTFGSWTRYPTLLIIDNEKGIEYDSTQCCKLLNALHEENQQLRKENEKLESLWEDKCIKEYMKIVGENALQEMHNEKYGDK